MKERLSPFTEAVLKILIQIPRGKVTTYRALAAALGRPRAARAAGAAVGKNPHAPIVPCHRVVRSDGRIGGYSGRGGIKTKIRLLRKEGVKINNGKLENFKQVLYTFND